MAVINRNFYKVLAIVSTQRRYEESCCYKRALSRHRRGDIIFLTFGIACSNFYRLK